MFMPTKLRALPYRIIASWFTLILERNPKSKDMECVQVVSTSRPLLQPASYGKVSECLGNTV